MLTSVHVEADTGNVEMKVTERRFNEQPHSKAGQHDPRGHGK